MKKRSRITTFVLSAAMIAGTFWGTPCQIVLAEDNQENEIKTVSTIEEHAVLARKAGAEGTVLLKNENQALPLKEGTEVALLGMNQITYVKGGTGSGNVNVPYIVNGYTGLKNKEKQGKIKIYQPLSQLYIDAYKNGETQEPVVDQSVVKDAAKEADTALVFIGRNSGEGLDRQAVPGDYYLTEE